MIQKNSIPMMETFFFFLQKKQKVVLQQFSIYGLNETYKLQIVFEQNKLVKQHVISFQN